MTPTARSMEHLRRLGWHVVKVEQRLPIPGKFVTRDAYGFGDLLACHPLHGITLVQVTSSDNLASRIAKARTVAGPLTAWLIAGGKLLAQGWALRGAEGERKRWTLREVPLTLSDLTAAPAADEVLTA